eukprot:IDg3254t1
MITICALSAYRTCQSDNLSRGQLILFLYVAGQIFAVCNARCTAFSRYPYRCLCGASFALLQRHSLGSEIPCYENVCVHTAIAIVRATVEIQPPERRGTLDKVLPGYTVADPCPYCIIALLRSKYLAYLRTVHLNCCAISCVRWQSS